MRLTILLLLALYLSGCAFYGDLNIYSPTGDSNKVGKSVDADLDSNVGLK